jgi:hypothetical protein
MTLQKEFDEVFENSPVASDGKKSRMYLAMYGAFMAGYLQKQREEIDYLKTKLS